jgi:hypothetical protein
MKISTRKLESRKMLTTFFLVFGCCLTLLGQSPSYYIKYDYDAAGNRISRRCNSVTLRSATAPIDSSIIDDSLDELKVSIYPNPTKGAIIAGLSVFNPTTSVSYILFSAEGRKLQQLVAYSDRTPIDLSNYSPGIYLLKIIVNKKELEFKIIKQ